MKNEVLAEPLELRDHVLAGQVENLKGVPHVQQNDELCVEEL